MFTGLLNSDVLPCLTTAASIEKQRTTVQLVAAVVRQSAGQVASVLGDIVPGILKAVQRDDDELREGCLQVQSSHFTSEIMLIRLLGFGGAVAKMPS